MAGYFKTEIVKEGTVFNQTEIEGAMKRQGIKSLEKGDVVMFYTGWMKLLEKITKDFPPEIRGWESKVRNILHPEESPS